MRSFLHAILILAIVCAANLHLPVLQVIAWTGMLVSYSQDRSFAEAAEMTFDGEHPCPMCKAIKKQQAAKHDTLQTPQSSPKLELFPSGGTTMRLTPPCACAHVVISAEAAAMISRPPELPPPRSA